MKNTPAMWLLIKILSPLVIIVENSSSCQLCHVRMTAKTCVIRQTNLGLFWHWITQLKLSNQSSWQKTRAFSTTILY